MIFEQSNAIRDQLLGTLEELADRSKLFRVVNKESVGNSALVPDPHRDPRLNLQPNLQMEKFDLEVLQSKTHIRLLVEFKTTVHPRQVVLNLAPLAAMARAAGGNAIAVLAATYISPRVAEVCREYGVSYFDAAGNAHLDAPGLHIHVEGRPNRTPDTRPAERIFAPKSSRVVRVMLEEPKRAWKIQELARTAKVSIGLASRIKQKLVEQAFALESTEGVRVAEPAKLLQEWLEAYKLPRQRVMVYSLETPENLEREIVRWGNEHEVTCALGEFSAASRLAPMVRSKRVVVYVQAKKSADVLGQMLQAHSLKRTDSGATAEIWVTDDESVFYGSREIQGARVVSPLQAYLDVSKNPARGEEAAAEIFRRLLKTVFSGEAVER